MLVVFWLGQRPRPERSRRRTPRAQNRFNYKYISIKKKGWECLKLAALNCNRCQRLITVMRTLLAFAVNESRG